MNIRIIPSLLLVIFISINGFSQTIQAMYQEQVLKLAENDKVKQAFNYILSIDEQTVQDMITLTEIPSPSHHEAEKGKLFAEML